VQKTEQKKGEEEATDHRGRSANSRRPPKLGDNEIIRVLVKLGTFKV
jgi:hypothetical protein